MDLSQEGLVKFRSKIKTRNGMVATFCGMTLGERYRFVKERQDGETDDKIIIFDRDGAYYSGLSVPTRERAPYGIASVGKPWRPTIGQPAMAYGYARRSGNLFTFNSPELVHVIGAEGADSTEDGGLHGEAFLIRWSNWDMKIHRRNLSPARRT